MITKQEILRIATETHLSPQVVEKDYFLGWLLAGINQHAAFESFWNELPDFFNWLENEGTLSVPSAEN